MELRILCLVILTLAGTEGLPGDTKQSSQCKAGWLYHEESCYLFVLTEMETWVEAMFHCNILHASLATILDERENNFIKSQLQLKHAPGCYYISATDIEVEGNWTWPQTDDPVKYMDWGPTEPQNAGAGEDCVCLSDGINYRWADVPCHSLRPFICKRSSDAGLEHEIIG